MTRLIYGVLYRLCCRDFGHNHVEEARNALGSHGGIGIKHNGNADFCFRIKGDLGPESLHIASVVNDIMVSGGKNSPAKSITGFFQLFPVPVVCRLFWGFNASR